MIAVDTNVLVYARREELSKHGAAIAALTELAEGQVPWGLPIFCIGEFVRVVSHPRLFDPPTSTENALAFVEHLLESPTARLLLPGTRFLPLFKQTLAQSYVQGNVVFDAQIAAVCLESGARKILTEDRDFARFEDLKVATLPLD